MPKSNAERQAKWRARVTSELNGRPIIYDVQNDEYRKATQHDVERLMRVAYLYGMARGVLRNALRSAEGRREAAEDGWKDEALGLLFAAVDTVLATDPNTAEVATAL